jgi:hypothetical protein
MRVLGLLNEQCLCSFTFPGFTRNFQWIQFLLQSGWRLLLPHDIEHTHKREHFQHIVRVSRLGRSQHNARTVFGESTDWGKVVSYWLRDWLSVTKCASEWVWVREWCVSECESDKEWYRVSVSAWMSKRLSEWVSDWMDAWVRDWVWGWVRGTASTCVTECD